MTGGDRDKEKRSATKRKREIQDVTIESIESIYLQEVGKTPIDTIILLSLSSILEATILRKCYLSITTFRKRNRIFLKMSDKKTVGHSVKILSTQKQ